MFGMWLANNLSSKRAVDNMIRKEKLEKHFFSQRSIGFSKAITCNSKGSTVDQENFAVKIILRARPTTKI